MTKRTQPITEFEMDDIEDVKIIIKAKGKHFGIVPKRNVVNDEEALECRKLMVTVVLSSHYVVSTALEDLKEFV